MANNHDQQPQHTYPSFKRGGIRSGRGRGRGEYVPVNCRECGEPGHVSRNCSVRNYAWRGNRASTSDPSKSDAVESASGTPNVRAKPMNTSTEDSLNVESAKVWLPQKNVNISPLLATIEQKEKELKLCGQKIDTLNSQLNKATTDLKCARAKNEDMAINMNSLQQELDQCRKELSTLKDKDKAWANKYWCLTEDMALNVTSLQQQLEKCNKEISYLEDKNEMLARKINEDKALKVKSLEQQLEKCNKEISSLKDKNEAWAKKYLRLNEDKALNVNSLQQELEQCRKELSSLKDKDNAWAKKYRCLNEDMAGNMNKHEQQIAKCNKEISSLKDKNEAWAKKYLRLNEDKALNVNSLQQELEQCRKELSSLKDKDNAWAKKYRCLNEDMAGNMNKHEQQIAKCNKEISSLKDKNEAWAKKYLRLNEDKALNVKSLEKKLEKSKEELSSLKDNDEAWAKKYLRLKADKALNVKSFEQQLEKCKKELSSLKDKDEAWAYKYRRLNEDMTIKVNSLQQELSSLKETAEVNCISFITSLWAKKYWCLNEDMAINMNSLKQQLEKCTKELSSLKDKDEALVKKWQALNKEFEETKRELNEKIKHLEEANETVGDEILKQKRELNLKIKHLEEANETVGDEILKQKLETEKWKKTAKAIASVLVGNEELCSETSELEPLVSYYTDRAAKRMSSKMFRKATDDCKMATYLDPGRLKARLIAGSCHLVLGEIDEALFCYNKCLNSEMAQFDKSLNREASNGLKNAKKVANNIKQSAEILQLKTFESATQAMKIIAEALSVSCYSEKLLKLKGEALFQLHKYEEVVQMCEQTLCIAEKNCGNINDNKRQSDEDPNRHLHLWRWSLMSRSYYRMGKFDMAVATLDKYEQLAPPETMTKGPSPFSAATVRELLRIKTAGNEAYQTGKYREAVDHYSDAIMRSIESRPFTAICLCNRAAAHQALGNVIDAIADCNLAIALDGDYIKAISRRANLHEKIRDYEEAALDFQRLVCLLEKRSEKKNLDELTIARRHLSSMNINRKKGMKWDLYLILGLKGSESGSEIKKAYHKAALKHHPDKAGKFLARSESGAYGHVLKEIFTTIQKDADKLFKKIGEAYAVLSDASKRSKYKS